jgi:hypothetical protein
MLITTIAGVQAVAGLTANADFLVGITVNFVVADVLSILRITDFCRCCQPPAVTSVPAVTDVPVVAGASAVAGVPPPLLLALVWILVSLNVLEFIDQLPALVAQCVKGLLPR